MAAANRAAAHLAIARRNGARIFAAPDLALAALTQKCTTFTRQDLALFINTHTADGAQFDAVMARVENSGRVCPAPARTTAAATGSRRKRSQRTSPREQPADRRGVIHRRAPSAFLSGDVPIHATPMGAMLARPLSWAKDAR